MSFWMLGNSYAHIYSQFTNNFVVYSGDKMFKRVKMNYSLGDFEPNLSFETLDEHYNVLYKKYTDNLNELATVEVNDIPYYIRNNFDIMDEKLKRNFGGYFNHTLYFENLIPERAPTTLEYTLLDQMIADQFGGKNNLMKNLDIAAKNSFASNYIILFVDNSNKLGIMSIPNQDIEYLKNCTPLLVMDLWEHSYYLDYKANRNKYINNALPLLNFKIANKRLEEHLKKR